MVENKDAHRLNLLPSLVVNEIAWALSCSFSFLLISVLALHKAVSTGLMPWAFVFAMACALLQGAAQIAVSFKRGFWEMFPQKKSVVWNGLFVFAIGGLASGAALTGFQVALRRLVGHALTPKVVGLITLILMFSAILLAFQVSKRWAVRYLNAP